MVFDSLGWYHACVSNLIMSS